MKCKILILLPILLISGCRSGVTGSREVRVKSLALSEMALIIDGRARLGWDVTNFGPQGPVYVSGDEIILGMGDGCTGITWRGEFPQNNYEVNLDAKRIAGNDFFCGMTFPAGKFPCTLIVGGWGGTTVGLSSIDGLDASDNATRKLMEFEKNHWYHIRMEVTGKAIKAWIDTINVVDFTIGTSRLSIRPEVELSKPFGIASWNTTAALRNIRVTRIGNR
jgi:3-keto-disaccharide hydrolase